LLKKQAVGVQRPSRNNISIRTFLGSSNPKFGGITNPECFNMDALSERNPTLKITAYAVV
jgi:hypothetical protein